MNKEQKREYYKQWHQKHKEQRNTESGAYYEANKERITAYHSELYLENKERHNANGHEWHQKNRETANARRRAWHQENREYALARQRETTRTLKLTILRHYSQSPTPYCACPGCNEQHIEFLTIDHINGGGRAHRKEIGYSRFYPWLVKNNFPPEYRVLCINCNFSLGQYEYCPHNMKSEKEESSEI